MKSYEISPFVADLENLTICLQINQWVR